MEKAIDRVSDVIRLWEVIDAHPAEGAAPPPSAPKRGRAIDQGRALAEAARERWGLGDDPLPELFGVIEDQAGLPVLLEPLGPGLDGLLVRTDELALALVHSSATFGRQRFTAADGSLSLSGGRRRTPRRSTRTSSRASSTQRDARKRVRCPFPHARPRPRAVPPQPKHRRFRAGRAPVHLRREPRLAPLASPEQPGHHGGRAGPAREGSERRRSPSGPATPMNGTQPRGVAMCVAPLGCSFCRRSQRMRRAFSGSSPSRISLAGTTVKSSAASSRITGSAATTAGGRRQDLPECAPGTLPASSTATSSARLRSLTASICSSARMGHEQGSRSRCARRSPLLSRTSRRSERCFPEAGSSLRSAPSPLTRSSASGFGWAVRRATGGTSAKPPRSRSRANAAGRSRRTTGMPPVWLAHSAFDDQHPRHPPRLCPQLHDQCRRGIRALNEMRDTHGRRLPRVETSFVHL